MNGLDAYERSNSNALSSASLRKMNALEDDINNNSSHLSINNLKSTTLALDFSRTTKARRSFLKNLPKRCKSIL